MDLIAENYRILSDAIDKGIRTAKRKGLKHEIPAQLTATLKENAAIFSGWKAYHALQQAGTTLLNKDGGIKSFSEFSKSAGAVFQKHKLNLRAEYQYSTQAAQMAAKWHDIEAGGDRYNLQYRTASDDRVREEHAAIDGTTLPPSDPFWKKYYPPNGWGCRCTAVQVRKSKYKQSDSKRAILAGDFATKNPNQQIFRFNAGVGKKAFPSKHPYFPKGCEGCDTKLQLVGKNKSWCKACVIIQKQAKQING